MSGGGSLLSDQYIGGVQTCAFVGAATPKSGGCHCDFLTSKPTLLQQHPSHPHDRPHPSTLPMHPCLPMRPLPAVTSSHFPSSPRSPSSWMPLRQGARQHTSRRPRQCLHLLLRMSQSPSCPKPNDAGGQGCAPTCCWDCGKRAKAQVRLFSSTCCSPGGLPESSLHLHLLHCSMNLWHARQVVDDHPQTAS